MPTVQLDRLLGREVHTANNRRLGRLEEFRAERRGSDYVVTEYVIGAAGLAERLGLGLRLILGRFILSAKARRFGPPGREKLGWPGVQTETERTLSPTLSQREREKIDTCFLPGSS